MQTHSEVEIFQQDGAAIHTGDESEKCLNKALGAENWTQPPPAPCKEIGNDGNFVTVQKTSTNGTTRNYKVDSTHCECVLPEKYVHPAKSPDFNPVEHCWTWMCNWLNQRPTSDTKEGFHAQIHTAWAEMPIDYIRKLFSSMPDRLQAVCDAGGYGTKY
jgi:hypothetical protein